MVQSPRVRVQVVYFAENHSYNPPTLDSDQLWMNDGSYKPPIVGQEFPLDLDSYPEYGLGWQNEEGVRIDMRHRLIPKVPLRSALKRPRGQEPASSSR